MNKLQQLIAAASDFAPAASSEHDLSEFKTTSAKIRYLNSKGVTRAEIAKTLNIRYQHVRNVLTQPLKQQ